MRKIKARKSCPNCKQSFKNEKDEIGTYKLGIGHHNPICPYRFSAFAHTEEQLNKNVLEIMQRFGFIQKVEPTQEIKNLLRIK